MDVSVAQAVIYMQPDCPGCENVRKFLKIHGVSYQERDITADSAAYAEFRSFDVPATPVTVIGAHRVLGFNRKALAHALGLAERQ